jgi:beta-phosphoglucomutase-like phosphatase (HAD superfamily)
VEDSPHGATAAKAAGLGCIAIPHPHCGPAALGSADLVLGSAAGTSLAAALGKLSQN